MLEYLDYIINFKVFIILFVIYLIYKYGKSQQDLHLKLGHKGPPPLPYLGNLVDIGKLGFHGFDKLCLQKYGRIYPFYFGTLKLSMVSDEELIKQIMIKESKSFTDRMDFGFNGETTEKMLTELKGKDWERIRYLISPAFTAVKLKNMLPMISKSISRLENRIAQHPEDKPIDCKEFFDALSVDVIAQTMFGMQIDSQTNPDSKFLYYAKRLFDIPSFSSFFAILLMFPVASRLIHRAFPKWEVLGNDNIDYFMDNMKKVIDKRKSSPEQYNDFLALMLNAQNETNDGNQDKSANINSKTITLQEIMAQSLIFLLAGYETTATTLTYVAYFLANNPIAQEEVYNEIIETFGDEGEMNYETIMNMPVLDAAISETLRLCPPLLRIDRVCTKDIELVASDNTKIRAKKDDIFAIPVYAIHTDPSIWPDPDKFDLHRFDPENKKNRSISSFLPFGLGPRSCIGMRLALLEQKYALVNLLRKYEFVTCPETTMNIKFKPTGFSTPADPIYVKIIKRE